MLRWEERQALKLGRKWGDHSPEGLQLYHVTGGLMPDHRGTWRYGSASYVIAALDEDHAHRIAGYGPKPKNRSYARITHLGPAPAGLHEGRLSEHVSEE